MATREEELLRNIKKNLPQLEELLASVSAESEDLIYRFYHQSFKVYWLQSLTEKIVKELKGLLPQEELNEWFLEIVRKGTGKKFAHKDNENWLEVTRPMLEAFFHARYFLEMAVRYGKELDSPPGVLPSGWAAILCLYNIR